MKVKKNTFRWALVAAPDGNIILLIMKIKSLLKKNKKLTNFDISTVVQLSFEGKDQNYNDDYNGHCDVDDL